MAVGSGKAPRAIIPLAGSAAEKQLVATVGYPAKDSRTDVPEEMDRIFGNIYDVKRLAPGEIMKFNPTVRKLVLEGEDVKLTDAIRLGRSEGMQDFVDSLKDLVQRDMIDRPTAFEVAPNAEALKMALKGIEVAESGML